MSRPKRKDHAMALKRLSSDYDHIGGSSLGSKKISEPPTNWKSTVMGCGSNAFGQLFHEGIDLMASKLQLILLPPENDEAVIVVSVCAGSTITGVVSASGRAYLWGSGIGGHIRVPQVIPVNEPISQLSCGLSHAAIVTQSGKVYTWGNGEGGKLGHGNKQSQSSPRMVAALSHLATLQVSCGSYHTAFIATQESSISYVTIPVPDKYFTCGDVYTCGVGKAGQLGLGSNPATVATPRIVTLEGNLKVAKVSCGMHHTLIIATPTPAFRIFTSMVYAWGFNESGRLGIGGEDSVNSPALVSFPEPFHPIDIAAGEQHSVATSYHHCYCWGSNSFGQCAGGAPNGTPMCLQPTKVPLPEQLTLLKVAAGGRHSGAISSCGKVLTWGWGEEGQLGHGTEKDSWLPKPVRCDHTPLDIALGLCHTMVIVENQQYIPVVKKASPPPPPTPVKAPSTLEPEPLPTPPASPEKIETRISAVLDEIPIVEVVETPPASPEKPSDATLQDIITVLSEEVLAEEAAAIAEESVLDIRHKEIMKEVVKPVVSLKDILHSREERKESNSALLLEQYQPKEVIPEPEPEEVTEIEDEVDDQPPQQQEEEAAAMVEETAALTVEEAQPRKPSKSGPEAELRKQKKAQEEDAGRNKNDKSGPPKRTLSAEKRRHHT